MMIAGGTKGSNQDLESGRRLSKVHSFSEREVDDETQGIIIESVITKNKKNTKVLIHPMAVSFPENAVTAILGPSGCGKTTLLNLLADNVPMNINAKASINIPKDIAFVPQDDRLHGFYTCRGYMKHYARLVGIAGDEDIDQRIDTLLEQLGLSDHADTKVGDIFFQGLSGGQKRRLSIALEALSNPNVFILDEPTSGLDAESALQVMSFLKIYVQGAPGRRVILTIHQPSSFIWDLIDDVVLLSKGKLMYSGPRSTMENFFVAAGYPTPEHWNPADFYITAVNDEFKNHCLSVEEWSNLFKTYTASNENDKHSSTHRPSLQWSEQDKMMTTTRCQRSNSVWVSFELVHRYFLNIWFNPGILLTRIAMYTMLGLVVGALFFNLGDRYDFESIQSRIAISFYAVAFFIFMSIAVLPFTVMEKAIVDKEVLNKYYHPGFYQLAQALCSIPSTVILAFLTTLFIVSMAKLREPLWYFTDMWLSLVVAEALAQLISHVVPHFIIGMALLAGLYGFFMLFMGFMLVPSDFPKGSKWLYNVAFHTYSFRTFMFTEFHGDQPYDGQFAVGQDVLAFYEIENVNRSEDMIVLFCYALIVHLMSIFVLVLRNKYLRGKVQPINV
jgi:ABC-type multidrug transport system ATPase subunit